MTYTIELNKPSEKPGTKVRLDWTDGDNGTTSWSEICIWAILQYGNPGGKYTWHPEKDHMIFNFADEKDAIHFMLRWS